MGIKIQGSGQEWMEWAAVGINISLCIVAVVCVCVAAVYLWRNYQLEALIVEYQKQAKEAALHKGQYEGPDTQPVQPVMQSAMQPMVPEELLALLQAGDPKLNLPEKSLIFHK